MRLECAGLTEAAAAHATWVRLLARVDAHVALQVDQLCRGVGAVRALVGLLPAAKAAVRLEAFDADEGF